ARRILREGTSADRQIAAFEATRGGDTSNRQALDAVVDWLAETTRAG
ncbi:carboxylate--amine ligase, partial [Methylorubrum rhodesianum]